MTRPIEIIGGGLAGLALGCALRREGVPVAIREAGEYPRHRVCGEFIAGLSPATIERLGLGPALSGAVPHTSVAWFQNGRRVRLQPLPEPALGISRHALDGRLAEIFRQLGGVLQTNDRAADVRPAAGRVIATGRQPAKSPWLGLKAHLKPAAGDSFSRNGLEVHLGERAYAGVSAVEGGCWNLCGLFNRTVALPMAVDEDERGLPPESLRHRALLRALRNSGLGVLAERIAPHIDPQSVCAVAGLEMSRTVRSTPGLSLGDAVGMIPPFTGNGMAMAFQGAERALPSLVAYAQGLISWDTSRDEVRRALRRKFGLRLASAGLLHPYLLLRGRQRWLARAARARLLPLRPLYILLH